MDNSIDVIPENGSHLTLNIADRDTIIVTGKGSEDKIILELKNKLCYSFDASPGSSVRSLAGSRDPRESLIISSKSISNKPFHDWKKDEAFDNATGFIEIRGTRLSPSERGIVLEAVSTQNGIETFVSKTKQLKGVFLLDPDLLSLVIKKYGNGIYKIIDQLNYNYHLCYLSETIYTTLYQENENQKLSEVREIVKEGFHKQWMIQVITALVCIICVIAVPFIVAYKK